METAVIKKLKFLKVHMGAKERGNVLLLSKFSIILKRLGENIFITILLKGIVVKIAAKENIKKKIIGNLNETLISFLLKIIKAKIDVMKNKK